MAIQAARRTDPELAAADYVLEDQVGFLLRRAHQRASAIFAARIGTHDLTPTQFAALAKIHDSNAISQNRLGRVTAMDPATMQGVIARLHDRGFIERASDPTDKRRTLLRLTPSGREAFLASCDNAKAISRETLAPLSAEERAAFLRLLKKLA